MDRQARDKEEEVRGGGVGVMISLALHPSLDERYEHSRCCVVIHIVMMWMSTGALIIVRV